MMWPRGHLQPDLVLLASCLLLGLSFPENTTLVPAWRSEVADPSVSNSANSLVL